MYVCLTGLFVYTNGTAIGTLPPTHNLIDRCMLLDLVIHDADGS